AGDLVSSFGSGGSVTFSLYGEEVQSLLSVVETSDGDIVASGFSSSVDGTQVIDALVRLNADGSFDTGFDGDGILHLPEDVAVDGFVRDVLALPDGDVLYARRSQSGIGGEVTRLNPDGTVDTAFGDGGT